MFFQERVPPRTSYKGFYLESLRVLAELWAEEPLKMLLRTFSSESAEKPPFA